MALIRTANITIQTAAVSSIMAITGCNIGSLLTMP
jgi:hypothetical protein